MKPKKEILKMLFSTLAEIQSFGDNFNEYDVRQHHQLVIQLELLYDILGDDVPEEFWEQIENIIYI